MKEVLVAAAPQRYRNKMIKKIQIKKFLSVIFTSFYLVIIQSHIVFASGVSGLPIITPDDLFSLQNNTPLFDPDAASCVSGSSSSSDDSSSSDLSSDDSSTGDGDTTGSCCSDSGTSPTSSTPPSTTTGGSATSSSHSTWSSTAQPPYYMEEFIINVLEDIAQKLNVPQSSAVTQEHVVALVGWAYAEGGNIANTGAYNLWNTGLTSRPDLLAGAGNGSGLESFNSFDSGVEANAISMTLPQYSRIGSILTQPNSTAEQVEHAIAYYDQTPNNEAWAWGNDPDSPAAVLQYNHTFYITSLMDQLTQARSSYDQEASVVIGPGEEDTSHVPYKELQYSGGTANPGSVPTTGTGGVTTSSGCSSGGSGTTVSSADCTSAVGDAKIICAAQPYSGIWYEWGGGHQGYAAYKAGCPNPANPPDNQPTGGSGIAAGDPGGNSGNPSPCAVDCSALVSMAVDDAFNQAYSWSVEDYAMQGSGAQYWKSIPLSSVQPGDIVTLDEHVEIVDHYDSSSGIIYTFGAHQSLTQVSEVSAPLSSWNDAYQWTGPGSNSN
jgi:hypothetical protein